MTSIQITALKVLLYRVVIWLGIPGLYRVLEDSEGKLISAWCDHRRYFCIFVKVSLTLSTSLTKSTFQSKTA